VADDELGWSSMLGLGITAASVLGVGIALGWLADLLFGTFPALVFVGVLLGVLGAASYLIVKFRSYLKN
jgi:F0F1-type ATP synthase assembly protein I